MNSIFDIEDLAYDKKRAKQLVLFLQRAKIMQRQNDIKLLIKEIHKKEIIYRKTKAKTVEKTKRKIELKIKRKKLKNLEDVQLFKTSKSDEYKLLLFKMMKKIVVKNIRNYLKIAKNSPVTEYCMNSMEMESEAYLVLNKCICNFSFNNKNFDFYYYYNSSLARNFYRMFDREVRKKHKKDNYSEQKINNSSTYINLDGDVEFLINQLGLSEIELKVIKSKLIGERKGDFFKKNKNISSSRYYAILKKIKQLILKMQRDGEF